MSDEGYDSDGDVGRYLQIPGRESYLLDVPEPEVAHPGGGQMLDQVPVMLGLQEPTVDAGQHQAPAMLGFQGPATIDAGQHQAPASFGFQAPSMDVEHHPPPAFGFQAQILGVEGNPAPAFGFGIEHQPALGFLAQIVDTEHHQTQVFGFQAPNVDVVEHHHHQPPFGFQQSSAVEVDHHQAPVFGQNAPATDMERHQASAFGFHSCTNDIEHGQVSSFVLQASAMDIEHHQTPDMDDFVHYQALEDVDDVEHHQAPAMDDVEHHQAPATEVQPQLEQEEAGVDNSSWVDEMLAEEVRVIFPPASPPREEEPPVEDEVDLPPVEDDFVYVPYVHGQLDCTRCHSVREVLHETGRRKLYFLVHVVRGAFQHAIIHHMSVDANGQFQTNQLLYVDFRNHSHGSVQNFIESKVEDLKKISNGRMQDICSTISAAPPVNDSHVELEISMLGNILMPIPVGEGAATESSSQPVMNEEQNSNAPEASSQDSSLSVTQAEENNNAESKLKPANWLGFTPDILESSQVKPYDPESDTSVLLYPSMLEKIHERQQARVSNLTMEDASKMFEEAKEEIAREPDLSSMIFKRLSRKDDTYRINLRRIKELNRKIKNLVEQPAQSISTSGLFSIRKKLLMYKQEKEDLFAIIEMGLQEIEKDNDDNAAGPSGSH